MDGRVHRDAERAALIRANFCADWRNRGLDAYNTTFHPERITVVDDPVIGADRQVLKMEVFNSDTEPTDNPRAQVNSPLQGAPQHQRLVGDEFWWGTGLYLPSDFPVLPANGWWVFAEVFGAPASGASPLAFGVFRDDDLIIANRNDDSANEPWKMPVQRETWVDFAFRVLLSESPSAGFWEVWVNTGSGWHQPDSQGRFHFSTLDESNSVGPNGTHLKNYRRVDMDVIDPVVCYFASHKMGRSLLDVDPHSHVPWPRQT